MAAGKLVRSYYAAIDAGDFAAAWGRLSPAVQAGFGGFAVWRGGYDTTLDQRVEAVETNGAQIRHVLVARDRTPCGTTVEQRFAVVWTVADGRASALHAAKLAGQDPAAAC
jgi:ketosteroid isomerase-like protein